MLILAIDTATDYLSVALLEDNRSVAQFHRSARTSHSRLLVPVVERMLRNEKLRLRDIDYFAVSVGPGSFTGLRIGITTVKALAFCTKKRIVAVPTLDAIAQNVLFLIQSSRGREKAKGYRYVCPVLDAKKKKVYACVYKPGANVMQRVREYALLPIGDLLKSIEGSVLFLGSGIDVYREEILREKPDAAFFTKADWHPRASAVGSIGFESIMKKKFVSAYDLTPLYLYSNECDVTGW